MEALIRSSVGLSHLALTVRCSTSLCLRPARMKLGYANINSCVPELSKSQHVCQEDTCVMYMHTSPDLKTQELPIMLGLHWCSTGRKEAFIERMLRKGRKTPLLAIENPPQRQSNAQGKTSASLTPSRCVKRVYSLEDVIHIHIPLPTRTRHSCSVRREWRSAGRVDIRSFILHEDTKPSERVT